MMDKLNPIHWRIVKRLIDRVRVKLFTRDPDTINMVTDIDVEELRELLGKENFTNSWELSYRYEGEDLNMRRPEYEDDEYKWYQLHVRAFDSRGATKISAHYELEPTEHPGEHLQEINLDYTKGVEMLAEILDRHEVDYDLIP